jgi:hypothetical protein
MKPKPFRYPISCPAARLNMNADETVRFTIEPSRAPGEMHPVECTVVETRRFSKKYQAEISEFWLEIDYTAANNLRMGISPGEMFVTVYVGDETWKEITTRLDDYADRIRGEAPNVPTTLS